MDKGIWVLLGAVFLFLAGLAVWALSGFLKAQAVLTQNKGVTVGASVGGDTFFASGL